VAAVWNNLLKLSVFSYLWRQYKKTIILLPLLLVFFWVVTIAHADYLAYIELQGDKQWIGASFIVKWLVLALGVVVFVMLHLRGNMSKNVVTNIDTELVNQTTNAEKEALFTQEINDSFDRIRKKDSLSSKADLLLKSKKLP